MKNQLSSVDSGVVEANPQRARREATRRGTFETRSRAPKQPQNPPEISDDMRSIALPPGQQQYRF